MGCNGAKMEVSSAVSQHTLAGETADRAANVPSANDANRRATLLESRPELTKHMETPCLSVASEPTQPMGEVLALQVAAALRKRPGFYNDFNHREEGSGDTLFLRVSLVVSGAVLPQANGRYVRDTDCRYTHESGVACIVFDHKVPSWKLCLCAPPCVDMDSYSFEWLAPIRGFSYCSDLGGEMTFRSPCGQRSCLVTVDQSFVIAAMVNHFERGFSICAVCETWYHNFDSETKFVGWLSKQTDEDLLGYNSGPLKKEAGYQGNRQRLLSRKRLHDYANAVIVNIPEKRLAER